MPFQHISVCGIVILEQTAEQIMVGLLLIGCSITW